MPKRYFERLQTIDYLIRIKGTGKPDQLAKRLRISQRTLYEFLKLMKDLGAPIEYDRDKESYYYKERGGFSIKFTKPIAAVAHTEENIAESTSSKSTRKIANPEENPSREKESSIFIFDPIEGTYRISKAPKPSQKQEKKKPIFGSAKGKIKMSPDFDDPLDNFKDYM